MEYKQLKALLADNNYMRELLNDGGILHDEQGRNHRILKGWIDEEASEMVTEKYGMLSAQDGTYLNVVKVVHDPEIPYDAVAVENSADRRRYILITLIPDVDLAYELNFPIIQTMGVMALSSWEFGRAATLASQFMAKIKLVEEPVPPILDNAVVEWVSLYVGRSDFPGGDNLKACCDEKVADPWSFDIHLYEARKMEDNPLIRKLVDTYDADCTEA